MQTIIDTTFTGKNISSAASVYEYTVVTAGTYRFQVRLAAVAGGGDYTIYLTLNDGDALTDDIIEPKSTITLAAGETKCWFVSSDIDLMIGDVVNVMVDGLAGDTNEAGSIRVFRIMPEIVAAVTTTVDAGTITVLRGDTLSAIITGLGSLANYSNLYFTVKSHPEDEDAASVVQIKKNVGGVGNGLTYLNGAASTAANASITIDDSSNGDITVMIKAESTTLLTPAEYGWDCQIVRSAGTPVSTLGMGTFFVTNDYTRAIA